MARTQKEQGGIRDEREWSAFETVKIEIHTHTRAAACRVAAITADRKPENTPEYPEQLYPLWLLSYCIPYGQNVHTRLPTEGHASTIACALACLSPHSQPDPTSIGTEILSSRREAIRDQGYVPNVTILLSHDCHQGVWFSPGRHVSWHKQPPS